MSTVYAQVCHVSVEIIVDLFCLSSLHLLGLISTFLLHAVSYEFVSKGRPPDVSYLSGREVTILSFLARSSYHTLKMKQLNPSRSHPETRLAVNLLSKLHTHLVLV